MLIHQFYKALFSQGLFIQLYLSLSIQLYLFSFPENVNLHRNSNKRKTCKTNGSILL